MELTSERRCAMRHPATVSAAEPVFTAAQATPCAQNGTTHSCGSSSSSSTHLMAFSTCQDQPRTYSRASATLASGVVGTGVFSGQSKHVYQYTCMRARRRRGGHGGVLARAACGASTLPAAAFFLRMHQAKTLPPTHPGETKHKHAYGCCLSTHARMHPTHPHLFLIQGVKPRPHALAPYLSDGVRGQPQRGRPPLRSSDPSVWGEGWANVTGSAWRGSGWSGPFKSTWCEAVSGCASAAASRLVQVHPMWGKLAADKLCAQQERWSPKARPCKRPCKRGRQHMHTHTRRTLPTRPRCTTRTRVLCRSTRPPCRPSSWSLEARGGQQAARAHRCTHTHTHL